MKVEEARKASGISSNLREHWVIGFRSFDIGKFGHRLLNYLKPLFVASALGAM